MLDHATSQSRTQSAEEHESHPCPGSSLPTELQTAPGSNISTRTVHPELHEMGFMAEQLHTRSPTIIVHNAECGLE